MTRLILASTSRYRSELLARIVPTFETAAPETDETAHPGESPATLATRLAAAKAESVVRRHIGADAIVIGSDQVADLDGRRLGKPGGHDRAVEQLRACSGREVRFHTAVHIVAADGRCWRHHDVTTVRFRSLTDTGIQNYLAREQPYDCAGSFRCEGLGISLFEAIEARDPTALVGLPLIGTCRCLRAAGLEPLASPD